MNELMRIHTETGKTYREIAADIEAATGKLYNVAYLNNAATTASLRYPLAARLRETYPSLFRAAETTRREGP